MHDLEIGHWSVKFHDLLILWGFDIHPPAALPERRDLSQAVKGTPCRAPSVARRGWEATLCSAHCSQALSTGAEDRQGCVHPGDPAGGGLQGAVLEHHAFKPAPFILLLAVHSSHQGLPEGCSVPPHRVYDEDSH